MNVERRIEDLEKKITPAAPFPFIIWHQGDGSVRVCQSGSPDYVTDEEGLEDWKIDHANTEAQVLEVVFGKS